MAKIEPVDKTVGERIRQRRYVIDWTQEALAKEVGVKFQQIQKYETGVNRVSASRLFMIAKALGTTTAYFFPQETIRRDQSVFIDRTLLEKMVNAESLGDVLSAQQDIRNFLEGY